MNNEKKPDINKKMGLVSFIRLNRHPALLCITDPARKPWTRISRRSNGQQHSISDHTEHA